MRGEASYLHDLHMRISVSGARCFRCMRRLEKESQKARFFLHDVSKREFELGAYDSMSTRISCHCASVRPEVRIPRLDSRYIVSFSSASKANRRQRKNTHLC